MITLGPRVPRWLRRTALVLGGILVLGGGAFLVAPLALSSIGGTLGGSRLERVKRSPHYRDGKFRNLVPTDLLVPGTIGKTLRLQLFGDEQRVPPRPPAIVPRAAADYAQPPASGLRVTWLGHASTLVEIEGLRVLTDPVLGERVSPVRFAGPTRFSPPPFAGVAALPGIDAVVISHDHYDHLDRDSVVALAARGARFVVPLGIGAHLERWGVAGAQVVELDWGESHRLGALTFTALPARHYSGRYPGRGDQTLWASWALVGRSRRVFFSGDTGYSPAFAEAGARLGPFDIALVKVGAYGPTWPDIHMTPEEAVRAHQDLRARLMLPIHWGTFNLAYHRWDEPADRVRAAARAAGVTLALPRPGDFVEALGSVTE